MHHPLFDRLGNPGDFLDQMFAALDRDQLDVSDFFMDHICYRVDNPDRYQECKQLLMDIGNSLTETQIGGRPIATFELHTPFVYQNRLCRHIELPAPKAGRFYPEGYEHVEFVVEDLAHLIEQHSHLPFQTKGINKAINPDVRLDYEGFSVKFHPYSLEYVIRVLEA